MLRPARQLILPAAIVLFWTGMMGVLAWREFVVPAMNTAPAVERPKTDQDLWMGIFVGNDEPVGFVNTRSEPAKKAGEAGAYLKLRAHMKMSLFGRDTELDVNGMAWLSDKAGLRDFDFKIRSGESDMQVNGAIERGLLRANLKTGGETMPFTLPVGDKVALLSSMANPTPDVPNLDVGKEVFIDTFDPTTMGVGKARVRCVKKEPITAAGKVVDAKLLHTTLGGFTSKAWVSETGEVLRAETPFGFTLKKITPEEALAPIAPGDQADLIRTMAVRAGGVAPRRDATAMTLRIKSAQADRRVPQSETQQFVGEDMRVAQAEPPSPADTAELPAPEREAALASEPLIQSDHEKIVKQAKEIAGDAADPWAKASRLCDWLYKNIEKEAVISVPSALDVLKTRRGDCNEHTTLYVAFARALGVPSRVAIGLVWSEELDGFGYHAWPEVFAGRWIPVDPTLGQHIADATHIKLFNGSIGEWGKLIPYVGQLQFEIKSVEGGEARAEAEKKP